jgi:hypothetical protein
VSFGALVLAPVVATAIVASALGSLAVCTVGLQMLAQAGAGADSGSVSGTPAAA